MSAFDRVKRIFQRQNEPRVRIHVIVHGRIGLGWFDVDRRIRVPVGTRLCDLIERDSEYDLPLREALANSPHLRDTLMLNGERCPIEEHGERELADGDQLYLLAPLAGG